MRDRVKGLRRDNGDPTKLIVDATSEDEAIGKVAEYGVVTEHVQAIQGEKYHDPKLLK